MKKIIVLLILIASSAPFHLSLAQNKDARQKIESARIALITERLGLTPEQAEKFWPLYNEYNQQRRALVQELQDTRKGMDMNNLSEDQSRQLMDMGLKIKERQLGLEKKYSKQLTDVISNQQMLSLRKAEEDFRKMLIERLEERKRQQMQMDQMQQRREEYMRNRGNN